MNQGLYNGFLAAGLFWGLLAGRRDVKIFFLLSVVAAGIFGGRENHRSQLECRRRQSHHHAGIIRLARRLRIETSAGWKAA